MKRENPYSSRKFLLASAVLVAATVLVWFEKIDSSGYVSLVIGVIGVYIAGNVTQKKVEVKA
jgi:FtsH-binding integral membrane protein